MVYNADEVSDWVKSTNLEAKFEGVPAKTVGQDRFYDGSNGAQQVDHEEQLYHPIASAIYGPVNQAAVVLELPLQYTMTRGMSISSNVVDHAVVANNHHCNARYADFCVHQFSLCCIMSIHINQIQ